VDYELLPVSRNTSTDELETDVERFADGVDSAGSAESESCDECEEPITEHADDCSEHPLTSM
jgi:hypothetical protein